MDARYPHAGHREAYITPFGTARLCGYHGGLVALWNIGGPDESHDKRMEIMTALRVSFAVGPKNDPLT